MLMHACRLCGAKTFDDVLNFGNLPIAHRLVSRRGEREERFPFALHVCRTCGLLQNLTPIDPHILYTSYNYNFSSWKPEPHLADEVERLMTFGEVHSVAEIGCNDGLFLAKLRDAGAQKLVGIEPNTISGQIARDRGLDIYGSMATRALCDDILEKHGKVDVVVARQVIEHIVDLDEFFACIDSLLKADGFVFFDVPDIGPACDGGDCSVLWEEHVNYFSAETFAALLLRHGLRVSELIRYNFSGGTLAVLARRCAPVKEFVMDAYALERSHRFGQKIAHYRERVISGLESARTSGYRLVLYGAGVRACMLVNGLGLAPYLDYAVDDQIERQGKFLPGGLLEIRSMESVFSDNERMVCILAVNQENEEKVKTRVRGLCPDNVEFISACIPGDIWGDLDRLDTLGSN